MRRRAPSARHGVEFAVLHPSARRRVFRCAPPSALPGISPSRGGDRDGVDIGIPSPTFPQMKRWLFGEIINAKSISPLEGEMSRQGQRGVRCLKLHAVPTEGLHIGKLHAVRTKGLRRVKRSTPLPPPLRAKPPSSVRRQARCRLRPEGRPGGGGGASRRRLRGFRGAAGRKAPGRTWRSRAHGCRNSP